MNFLGIGGLELVVVMLVALFVVGPVRLVEGARTARKYMTEIRRQREELTQMIEEAADLEGLKEALDQDGVMQEVESVTSDLNAFREEASSLTSDIDELKDVARSVRRPAGYAPSRPQRSSDKSDSKPAASDSSDSAP